MGTFDDILADLDKIEGGRSSPFGDLLSDLEAAEEKAGLGLGPARRTNFGSYGGRQDRAFDTEGRRPPQSGAPTTSIRPKTLDEVNPPGTQVSRGIERSVTNTRAGARRLQSIAAATASQGGGRSEEEIVREAYENLTGEPAPEGIADLATAQRALLESGVDSARINGFTEDVLFARDMAQLHEDDPSLASDMAEVAVRRGMEAGRLDEQSAAIPDNPNSARFNRIYEESEDWTDLAIGMLKDPEAVASVAVDELSEEAIGLIFGGGAGLLGRRAAGRLAGAAASSVAMPVADYLQEYQGAVAEFFSANKIDVGSEEGLRAFLSDPALVAEAQRQGIAKASVISLVEGMGQGVAASFLLNSPVGDAIVKSLLTQPAFAAGGEAAAGYAATGEVNGKDVLVEGVMEALLGGPADVGVAALSTRRDSRIDAFADRAAAAGVPPAGGGETPPTGPMPGRSGPGSLTAPYIDHDPTEGVRPQARPQGLGQALLTDEDRASPIPDEVIASGKATMAEADGRSDKPRPRPQARPAAAGEWELADVVDGDQETGRQVWVNTATNEVRDLDDPPMDAQPAAGDQRRAGLGDDLEGGGEEAAGAAVAGGPRGDGRSPLPGGGGDLPAGDGAGQPAPRVETLANGATVARDPDGKFNTPKAAVPVEQAKRIGMPVEIDDDPDFREAIEKHTWANLTEEGLEVDTTRFQKRAQAGSPSVRGGVFYLVKGDTSADYSGTEDRAYGGPEKTEARTLFKRPLVVYADTGGGMAVSAYRKLKGPEGLQAMQDAVKDVAGAPEVQARTDVPKQVAMVENLLTRFGGDPSQARHILLHSDPRKQGQLFFALQENIVGAAARRAGYDSIMAVDHRWNQSWREDRNEIAEIFDLREANYPIPGQEGQDVPLNEPFARRSTEDYKSGKAYALDLKLAEKRKATRAAHLEWVRAYAARITDQRQLETLASSTEDASEAAIYREALADLQRADEDRSAESLRRGAGAKKDPEIAKILWQVASRVDDARNAAGVPRPGEAPDAVQRMQAAAGAMGGGPKAAKARKPETLASLDHARKVASAETWATGRALKARLQEDLLAAAKAEGQDLTDRDYLVGMAVKDGRLALEQNPNAVGWYDLKTRQALAIMALRYPEILTDEDARFAFTWALAVTSNGVMVDKNFELAAEAYRRYEGNKRMPDDIGVGTAKGNIDEALALFNDLVDRWGIDELRRFMLSEMPAGQITKATGIKISGESAKTVVRGSAILGPKIGNGFFSNLYGHFASLTMDRWLVRTWGRWTGTLIVPRPDLAAGQRTALREALEALPEGYAERLLAAPAPRVQAWRERLIDLLANPQDSDDYLDAVALASAETSKAPEQRAVMNDAFRKAANNLFKTLDAQKEAPAGAKERQMIRSVFGAALLKIRKTPAYKALTMADLQAVLWYGEKRLYETAKADGGKGGTSYTDGEAPDYANAAAALVRKMGVSQEAIDAAMRQEEDRGRDGRDGPGRPADAGPGDRAGAPRGPEDGEPGGDPGDPRGQPDSAAPRGPRAARPRAGGPQRVQPAAPLPGAPRKTAEWGPDPRIVAAAETYAQANGITLSRQAEYARVDPARAARIAAAYEAMPHDPSDPAVARAYADLIRQTRAQYDALVAAGITFRFYAPDDVYGASPWNALRDLRESGRMGVYPTEAGFGSSDLDVADNPLLAETGLTWDLGGQPKRVLANDLFRAVHDAFGHSLESVGFRADGEENAWQAHVRLFYGDAVGAMTSETRGQNSWLNYGPHGESNRTAKVEDTVFADQKTGLMPAWTWEEGRVGDMGATKAARPVTARTPELQEAARKVAAGEMSQEAYQRLVDLYKPVAPYEAVPAAATRAEMAVALDAGKRPRLGATEGLERGAKVGLRLDIPAYTDHGVWVVSVHEQQAGFSAGPSIGYTSVARATNATMGMPEKAALSIAQGKPKSTIATIKGDWTPTTPQEAKLLAERALKDPAWVQVGMDPERHSFFYDRASQRPVVAADEVIQIGPLVLAKNPTYADPKAYKFAKPLAPGQVQESGYGWRGGLFPGAEYVIRRDALPLLNELNAKLQAEAERMNLRGVKLAMGSRLTLEGKDGEKGNVDGLYFAGAIAVAMENTRGALKTMRHEAIHFLADPHLWGREYGLFTAAEWTALVRLATSDPARMARIREDYEEGDWNEEAVANLFEDWAEGRVSPTGFQRTGLQKIKAFFEAMGNLLRGMGFQTAEQVMERIFSGEVGARADTAPKATPKTGLKAATPEAAFFSPLLRAVEGAKQKAASAQDWLAILPKMPGVKQVELEWTGVLDWLRAQPKGQIPREAVAEVVRQNQLSLTEEVLGGEKPAPDYQVVRRGNGRLQLVDRSGAHPPFDGMEYDDDTVEIDGLGTFDDTSDAMNAADEWALGDDGRDTSFEDYTEDGGDNYREILLRVPNLHEAGKNTPTGRAAEIARSLREAEIAHQNAIGDGAPAAEIEELDREMRRLQAERRALGSERRKSPFVQIGHFPQENIVVHARVKDRKGPNGERVLFVEEIQSDLGSKWRESQPESAEVRERRAALEATEAAEARIAMGIAAEIADLVQYAQEDGEAVFPSARQLGVDEIRRTVSGAINEGAGGPRFGSDRTHIAEFLQWVLSQDEIVPRLKEAIRARRAEREASNALLAMGTEKKIDAALPATPWQEEMTYQLMVRRLLQEAARGGYDMIAWTPGYMQAERWDSAAEDVFERAEWFTLNRQSGPDTRLVSIYTKGDRFTVDVDPETGVMSGQDEFEGKNVSALLGPQIAGRIRSEEEGEADGGQMAFPHTGYAIAYDQQIKSAVDKIARKHGSRVESRKDLPDFEATQSGVTGNYSYEGRAVWAAEITPEMRESARGPQPMFAKPRRPTPVQQVGVPFIPDRSVWDELLRGGNGIWGNIKGSLGAMSDLVDRVRVEFQDKFLPVLRAQQAIERATGKPLAAAADAYQAETTYSGRVGRRLFEIDNRFTKPILAQIAGSKGLTRAMVDEFLLARHAEERNRHIASINPAMPDGGSGMSTADARAKLAAYRAGPHAAALGEVARLIDQMRREGMRLRVQAGLMTAAEANQWRMKYRFYVPLQGWEETDYAGSGTGSVGMGVTGAESKRAMGRGAGNISQSPLAVALVQAQELAIRAEKNRVAQRLYEMMANNPAPDLWEEQTVILRRVFNTRTGLVETRAMSPLGPFMEEGVLAVKVGGQEKRIKIKDPRLVQAIGLLGTDQMSDLTRWVRPFGIMFSMMRTTLALPFVVVNGIRDLQTGLINIGAFGENKRLGRNDAAAIRKAMLTGWLPAAGGSWGGMKGKNATRWQKHFEEFQRAGGQISFWKVDDPQVRRGDLDRRLDLQTGGRAVRALKHLKPANLASTEDNPLLAWTERLNLSVDNAMRLSAYVKARELGWTKDEAAVLAKELTVNFNRKGRRGAAINAWFAFFNSSVQGTTRLIQAAGHKSVRRTMGALVLAGFINDLANAYTSPDADRDGLSHYDEIPEYLNMTRFQMGYLGGEERSFGVPMAYGYNVFPYAGQQIGKVLRGAVTPGGALGNLLMAGAGAFVPISGSNPYTLLSPTITDPVVETALNRNFMDGPIYPLYPEAGRPDAYQHFPSATATAQWTADALNRLTGGDAWNSGAIDVSPETLDYATSYIFGSAGAFFGQIWDMGVKTATGRADEIEIRGVPLVRTFFSQTSEWTDAERFYGFTALVEDAHAKVRGMEEQGGSRPTRQQVQLADLYEGLLAARREMRGQGQWKIGHEDYRPPREDREIQIEFNRQVMRVVTDSDAGWDALKEWLTP